MEMPSQSSNAPASAGSIPSEVIELASRMYNAAREGDIATLQQALPAGIPPNLTNEKGDTLVSEAFSIRGLLM